MIIGVCGFGSTGSSAVSDYLLEYGDYLEVLDKIEFTWVSAPDSLIDLQYHLFNPHNRTADSITAINRYLQYCKDNEEMLTIFGASSNDVRKSAQEFIDSITDVSWDWYDFSKNYPGFIQRVRNYLIYTYIPKVEQKKGNQIKSPLMTKVSLSMLPEDFEIKARKHVKELLKMMGASLNKPLVLDQPFSGNNPQACFPYYEDPYAIVVDRDPRDNYVFAKTKLLGRNHFMAINTVYDFIKYYKAIRHNQPYRNGHDRVLNVQFEDMVYNYDETTRKIQEFLGFPENDKKKTIFDPSLSINNTQVWKRFPEYQEDIKIIEQELMDYLYDFSKYGDIEIKGEMFFGKSPLNK